MAPLYPFKFESLKINSNTQNLVMDALKAQFPRDFKPKTLGKRIDFQKNIVTVNTVPQKAKKREIKLETKEEPEPEFSAPVICLDSDSEEPLQFALRIQKELHNSEETAESVVEYFDMDEFSNLVNRINQ